MGVPLKKSSHALSSEDYAFFRKIAKERAGIELGDNKHSLVEARVLKRLREKGFESVSDYRAHLAGNPEELGFLVNVLTTNKTEFFRESQHFDFLKGDLKSRNLQPYERVLFWSAACSSGEEVYTLAMLLELQSEFRKKWDYRILGTDINTDVLQACANGLYPKERVQRDVSPEHRERFFQKESVFRDGKAYDRVHPRLQDLVKFRQFNLMDSSLPVAIRFDYVFLRNVLIYFSHEDVIRVIRRVSKYLKPDGTLFLSHSETLPVEERERFDFLAPSVFRKKEEA